MPLSLQKLTPSYTVYEEPRAINQNLKNSKIRFDDKDFFIPDAVSDDVFARCLLYASPAVRKTEVDSPKAQNNEIDLVENITVQIFSHLHSIADRKNRSEIEAAIAPLNSPSPDKQDPFKRELSNSQKLNSSNRFRPFRRETNFFEVEDPDQVIHTKHVAYNIFSTLGKILLGYEFFDSQQDSRSNDEMETLLRNDRTVWNSGLKANYTQFLQNKMSYAFQQAEGLLKFRENFAKEAYYQRLTLYATLIISCVGKLISQKALTILGLTASAITLLFMLTHYGTSSIKLTQLSSELKRSLEVAEAEACRHRVYPDPLEMRF